MTEAGINIFWFRRDLRLADNAGLYHALKSASDVCPIFIFDETILTQLPRNDARVEFIHQALTNINEELQDLGSKLTVYVGKPLEVWKEILRSQKVAAVYTNHDYEPYALSRDTAVANLLKKNSVEFHTFKDQCVFEKNEVVKDDGKPYTVFTPYKRKWLSHFDEFYGKEYPSLRYKKSFKKMKWTAIPSLSDVGFLSSDITFPTKKVPREILLNYDKNRDFPARDATTRLGVHLRFGTVSIRKCAQIAQATNDVWLSELIWRDFFMQILFHFPHVASGAFRPEYDKIKWRNDSSEFAAWCAGRTGYPLVDAGMRELNNTGYMHNRVRMVTASFLTKHLLIDWRWGEKYFAEKLLDFDLSANNGNWQWAAGTGCDAAPYFRVFNPSEQLKKFDADLRYVKTWVEEYGTDSYPSPIVDHKFARDRVLKVYKAALK